MSYDLAAIEAAERKREIEIVGEREDWIPAFYNPKLNTFIFNPTHFDAVLKSTDLTSASVRDGKARASFTNTKIAFTAKAAA